MAKKMIDGVVRAARKQPVNINVIIDAIFSDDTS
jgi:hypothetical protein